MTGKKMTAKPTTTKTSAIKKQAKPAAGASSDRAAEVEANLGGSQPLREFLRKAGWF
jgi:hypothetical protein